MAPGTSTPDAHALIEVRRCMPRMPVQGSKSRLARSLLRGLVSVRPIIGPSRSRVEPPSVKRRPESSTVLVLFVVPAPSPMIRTRLEPGGWLLPASVRSPTHVVRGASRLPEGYRRRRLGLDAPCIRVRTSISYCERWLPRGPIILLFALLGRQVGPACALGGSMGRGAIYSSALDCGQGISRAHPPKTMTCRNHRLLYSRLMPPRPQSA